MKWLFASGHAIDIVLAVIAIEFFWLVARRDWTMLAAVLRLGPAALMMLALRAAIADCEWYWIALPLALSFPIHLADIKRTI